MRREEAANKLVDTVPYCAGYCEENVYRFLERAGMEHAAVLVISNRAGAVAMNAQRAGVAGGGSGGSSKGADRAGRGRTIYWDYHVIVLARDSRGAQIYDADTSLPFPCPAQDYLAQSFPAAETAAAGAKGAPVRAAAAGSDELRLLHASAPRFKCLSADFYLRYFHSDRRHMRQADGSYLAGPPQWPAIRPELGTMLPELTDMRHALYARPLALETLQRYLQAS